MMLQEVFRLLGVDLDHKLAQIRVQVEELKARTTRQITEQIKDAGFMVGFTIVGTIAAGATFVIILVALYRWLDMHSGPFAALTAVGAVMALLAAVMYGLAFERKNRKPSSAVVDSSPAASPPQPPPPRPVTVALSDALPPPPPNASLVDILTHRFSTRAAGASDEAVDAAVHIMRTGSKSALFGTLAVVALVGVLIGRRR